jgi:hypothetical protein
MDVVMSQMKEYEETFGSVTKEFGNMIFVLAERLGDEATLKMLQEAKKKLNAASEENMKKSTEQHRA